MVDEPPILCDIPSIRAFKRLHCQPSCYNRYLSSIHAAQLCLRPLQGILGAIDTAAPGHDRLFNIGNTHPHTISEFVDSLEKALGKPALRHYTDLPRLGDVLQTHSDISAARDAFGYQPTVALDDGLKRFAAWFYGYYGPDGRRLRPDELLYSPLR
jgi:hypothetical protein